MDKGYSVPVAIIVFNRKYLAERMLECLEKVKTGEIVCDIRWSERQCSGRR